MLSSCFGFFDCSVTVTALFLAPCSLLLAIVAYVVIGIGVNAGIRNKQGIEMIPNVAFWKDFPFLLKVHVNEVCF